MRRLFAFFALIVMCVVVAAGDPVDEAELVRKGVVRIRAQQLIPNYREPWKSGGESGGVGTGFIIDGLRIMTNAHVVSNAVNIRVNREGDSTSYSAKVKFIAHDCDLAVLEVDDETFFKDSRSLLFGGVPKINSTVAAYGYPIGGQRMSVTRGIVSRIDFITYSHTGLDSHLAIQVDAAINPGNSGGPIVQDGKVVGVAFQGYSGAVAQNTGYMIPTPVINRMLEDVKDGRYDGYMELAVYHLGLTNPALRRYVGLENGDHGVLVTDVMDIGSASGLLKTNDILVSVDGYPIDSAGDILMDGEKMQLEETVERKFAGHKVVFDVIRDGTMTKVHVPLKKAEPFRLYAWSYDERPEFVLFAGLLFQPVDRNLIAAHKIQDPDVQYYYNFFIRDAIYLERPQLIVLSSILPDPINSGLNAFTHKLVDTINDVPIMTIEDVAKAFQKNVKHHVIRLHRVGRPIILDADEVDEAIKRITRQYMVTEQQYLRE